MRKNGKTKLYGYVVIRLGDDNIYTQWSLNPNTDWSKGEDLIFNIHEETDKVIETLKNTHITGVEIYFDRIKLWLETTV
jgi:hypothetical protein